MIFYQYKHFIICYIMIHGVSYIISSILTISMLNLFRYLLFIWNQILSVKLFLILQTFHYRSNLYLTKNSEKESKRIKMCCINIHLTVNPFTFSRLHKQIIVHDCYVCTIRIKRFTTRWFFFSTNFMVLLIFFMRNP